MILISKLEGCSTFFILLINSCWVFIIQSRSFYYVFIFSSIYYKLVVKVLFLYVSNYFYCKVSLILSSILNILLVTAGIQSINLSKFRNSIIISLWHLLSLYIIQVLTSSAGRNIWIRSRDGDIRNFIETFTFKTKSIR